MPQPLMHKLIEQLEDARKLKGITKEQLVNIDVNIKVCEMQIGLIKKNGWS